MVAGNKLELGKKLNMPARRQPVKRNFNIPPGIADIIKDLGDADGHELAK